MKSLKMKILRLQLVAHQNQMDAAHKQLSFHDAHAKAHTFHEDDIVWVYRQSEVEKGVTSKLLFRWKGPYVIVEKVGEVTYRLMDMKGKVLAGTVHARHLYKPY